MRKRVSGEDVRRIARRNALKNRAYFEEEIKMKERVDNWEKRNSNISKELVLASAKAIKSAEKNKENIKQSQKTLTKNLENTKVIINGERYNIKEYYKKLNREIQEREDQKTLIFFSKQNTKKSKEQMEKLKKETDQLTKEKDTVLSILQEIKDITYGSESNQKDLRRFKENFKKINEKRGIQIEIESKKLDKKFLPKSIRDLNLLMRQKNYVKDFRELRYQRAKVVKGIFEEEEIFKQLKLLFPFTNKEMVKTADEMKKRRNKYFDVLIIEKVKIYEN